MGETATGPQLLYRQLAADADTLDCLARPTRRGREVRWFGRQGAKLVSPDPALPIRQIERREVAGALLLVARLPSRGPLTLPFADGPRAVTMAAPDTDFLKGRNCLLAFRSVETIATIIDWLSYHARTHAATGAVIVNRARPDPAFAEGLASALSSSPKTAGLDLRVVLLDSPVPLGKADTFPEDHPIMAPDAPGKDRMEQPSPDPFRAPIGEGLINEVAKWRFLTEARAVVTLDCSDILAPPDGPTAFDRCVAAKSGVILLVGRRIYPWRVRRNRPETFGDHICRQFDARRGIVRWGVVPARAGLERTWRSTRVAFARPDPTQTVPFWRAMGLRVPGRKAGELAPKTSLVEDPELLAVMRDQFGAKPVRPPLSTTNAVSTPSGRTCIVTTMKNEGPFILEWIAYHRAIGVDDFLIYTNDCTDGTDEFLDILQDRGLVQHRTNPFRQMPGLKPQHAALQAAEEEPVVRQSSWVICMDVDEFINIRIGDGRLPALYAAMGDANMISLTWRMFGNADVAHFTDRFVIEQFTHAAHEMTRKPHQAWGFKTLFRNIAIYKKLGVHRPKGLKPDLWDQVKWLNGSGQPMPRDVFRNGWRSSTETFGYDWVSLNHYACRSAESFLVKRERGRVNHVDRDQGLNYWFRMNHNATEDRTILTKLALLQAEWDRLMADTGIRAAHLSAVAAHQSKIAQLMSHPAQVSLYDALTGERMRALSRMLRHFGASVFNAGPDAIPHDLHRWDIPEDFLFTVDHQGDAEH